MSVAAEASPLTTIKADLTSRLVPGDLIKIEVFDNADLTVSTRVPGSGTVTFPLIGELPPLAGITAEALSRDIARRLEDGYLRKAQVTVAVLEYGKRQAYVLGSVRKPGAVDIAPGRSLSALQAISDSAGFTEDASTQATQLLREVGPEQPRIVTSLGFTGDGHDAERDVILIAGDVVVVPRADRVYVIGTVAHPGSIPIPNNEPVTVSKAISLAGGFDRFAKQAQVQLLRNGTAAVTIDVSQILSGESSNDPLLKPGDTVFVPESRF